LSGIGLYDDRRRGYTLPIDETAQWTTMGDRYIEIWSTWGDEQENAFLFHNTCWELLMEHFGHGELHLDRLFEVCCAAPPPDLGSS
jgi:hypothetical protein